MVKKGKIVKVDKKNQFKFKNIGMNRFKLKKSKIKISN